MKVKKIEKVVLKVLKEKPETRSDDFLLIYHVVKETANMPFEPYFCDVMLQHKELGIPSFHSITRARRKLFEKYPYLKPEKTTKKREEKEVEFKAYALNE